ncbi:glycerophosphodiester phosphodiesterase family protein [bacterium]|nr:glycerophosphodiester phosphodiesterase family protein [bacterium]
MTAENVSKIQKEGYKVYPWTVNEKEAIHAMIAFGVEGIITDFPERVRTSK